jgi:hypothetical protein
MLIGNIRFNSSRQEPDTGATNVENILLGERSEAAALCPQGSQSFVHCWVLLIPGAVPGNPKAVPIPALPGPPGKTHSIPKTHIKEEPKTFISFCS